MDSVGAFSGWSVGKGQPRQLIRSISVSSGDYGWDAEAETGLVIVLRAFDAFTRVDRPTAQILLDIFARQAGCAMLIGHRIICLVQSNDSQLAFDPVGAMPVMWSDAEWLDSTRGV